jgi:ABC-type sugar transport system substrate-binding protein
MENKIGLFQVNCTYEYHRICASEAEEAARSAGIELEVFDSKNTAALEAQNVIRFTNANPGKRLCVLVTPVMDATDAGAVTSDATYQLARRVLKKGVGWITLNHGRQDLIASLRVEFPALPVSIVAIENFEFGRIQARQLRALLPQGGTTLCVLGNPFDSASHGRLSGLKEELKDGGITLEEIDGRWDGDVAEADVYKWLMSATRRQQQLDAVVCQNDTMGMGARKALMRVAQETARPELARIPVLGGDGLRGLGQRWVNESQLTATVCVTLPGKSAVELLVQHWLKGSPLPPYLALAPTSYPPIADLRTAR